MNILTSRSLAQIVGWILVGYLWIDVAQADWKFTPASQESSWSVVPGVRLSEQMPKQKKCCHGFYSATLSNEWAGEASAPISLWIPAVGGLEAIEIDGRVIDGFSSGSTTGISPLLPVTSNNQKIDAKIYVRGPDSRFTGLWGQNPEIGPTSDLTKKRDFWILHQIFVPLLLSVVFAALAAALLRLGAQARGKNPLVKAYFWTLLLWSMFYFYLSGLPRNTFPEFGNRTHFLVRCAAGLASVSVLLTLSGVKQKVVGRLTWIPLLLLLPLGIFFGDDVENIYIFAFFLVHVLFVGSTAYLGIHGKSALARWTFWVCILVSIGNTSDAIKLVKGAIAYPIPFLDRYVSPLFLFGSVIFIIDELAKYISTQGKEEAIEEATEQLLHDLRSPVSSLKLLTTSSNGLSPEERELFHHGIRRISEVTNSVQNIGKSRPVDVHVENSIQSLLKEKTREFPEARISFRTTGTGQALIKVNEGEFERVISNIINNAVESYEFSSEAEVNIEVTFGIKRILVMISDKGKGISAKDLNLVGTRGLSFGKENGTGLGLHYAKTRCEAWGGKLAVRSREGIGTSVDLILPVG